MTDAPRDEVLTDGQLIEAAIGEYIDARKIDGTTHTQAVRRAVQWALSNRHRAPSAPREWQSIHTRPDTNDLMWFTRGDTVDGPRQPSPDDADCWDFWCYAKAPMPLPEPPQ